MPGIDTDIFRPQDKVQCRATLGVRQGAFVIAAGAASLTDRNKNIRWLLEQLAELPELENVIVLLAGEGAVQLPVGLNLRLMGGIADPRTRALFYGAADIFASASLMETYGLTLVEAMGCGTPVVAFRTGGIPEAVPDGQAGILCELLDRTAFKRAIEKLRTSREVRCQLGTGASSLALSRNDKDKFAEAFKRVYEECVHLERTSSAGPSILAA